MNTIFSSPSFADIADEVVSASGARRGSIEFDTFGDDQPNFFINRVREDVAWQTVWHIADLSKKADLFDNLSVIQALPRYGADKVHIVVPYFPTGTMERVDTEGQIATAKTLARTLSATPAGEYGNTAFHIFDIHALQERFYFDDTVSVHLHSAIGLIQTRIADVLNLSIAFPDDGAYKRFGRDFPDTQKIICTKVRDGNRRIVTVKEGAVEGRNILIVDDLIQSGGTIRESAEKFRNMGAKSVSAYATHGVFPGNSHESLIQSLDRLYVTDSIPCNAARFAGNEKVEVLSIALLVSELVWRNMD